MQSTITPAILLLDLVPSALAGIDLISFTVTPRFRGIKDLSNGWHFVFTGTSNALSVRHGLWFRVTRQDDAPFLAISRWKADSETLIVERDEAEILRWRANIGELWREGLAPYQQSNNGSALSDWPTLTSCISDGLLTRVLRGDWILTSASSATQDRDNIPGINEADFDAAGVEELHLLPIDLKKTWRDGATGRERTDSAMDRSWALGDMITYTSTKQADEIIGELQFCFLMTLTLNNWSCFEQWKRILSLVFTSRSSVQQQADFFVKFIAAVRLQLQHLKDAEGGLIDMEDESSLLKSLLVRFRAGLQDNKSFEVQDVVDELDDIESYLRDQFGWEFGGSFARSGVLELDDGEEVAMDTTAFDEDDETGEYAPAVVELSAEQMRMLDLDESDVVGTLKSTRLTDLAAKSSAPLNHVQDIDEEDSQHVMKHTHAGEQHTNVEEDNDDMEEETADLEDLDERY